MKMVTIHDVAPVIVDYLSDSPGLCWILCQVDRYWSTMRPKPCKAYIARAILWPGTSEKYISDENIPIIADHPSISLWVEFNAGIKWPQFLTALQAQEKPQLDARLLRMISSNAYEWARLITANAENIVDITKNFNGCGHDGRKITFTIKEINTEIPKKAQHIMATFSSCIHNGSAVCMLTNNIYPNDCYIWDAWKDRVDDMYRYYNHILLLIAGRITISCRQWAAQKGWYNKCIHDVMCILIKVIS